MLEISMLSVLESLTVVDPLPRRGDRKRSELGCRIKSKGLSGIVTILCLPR
jgi:hypothetical protein